MRCQSTPADSDTLSAGTRVSHSSEGLVVRPSFGPLLGSLVGNCPRTYSRLPVLPPTICEERSAKAALAALEGHLEVSWNTSSGSGSAR